MKRRVITVDGNAGSGKTALSKLLAEKLGYVHLSTGLLYRAVGFLALQEKINLSSGAALADLTKRHSIQLNLGSNSSAQVLIDGREVGAPLHSPDVSEATSRSSQFKEVREALIGAQRNAFPGSNLVVEGRDMGTVVFPDADLKFFIQADPKVRVNRRILQLHGQAALDRPESFKNLKREIEIEILERDERDSSRALSPTKAADDAIVVDNSAETLTLVLQNMYDAAANRGLV